MRKGAEGGNGGLEWTWGGREEMRRKAREHGEREVEG